MNKIAVQVQLQCFTKGYDYSYGAPTKSGIAVNFILQGFVNADIPYS